MIWLFLAIAGYFLLAVAALVDKYLLAGPLPNPKTYTFYVGLTGGVGFLLIPFFLEIPSISIIALGLIAGALRIVGLFAMFSGLFKFEASRIIPALGGGLAIFTAVFTFLLAGETEIVAIENILPFLLLVGGAILISIERRASVTLQSLLYALVAAFFLAISFVFSKFVYLAQPFLSGLIWMLLGGFLTSLLFLGSKELREQLRQRESFPKKTALIFVGNQVVGGGGVLFLSLAVFLVPFGLLPLINAVSGTEYVFLFILALLLSWRFPGMLKERISLQVIIQKIISLLLIGTGLALFAF